uniref:Potassium channel domain-containing protein n=1 Tax=Poecilia mexicana TaxID=48701 RepID=A0A3B3WFU9_9TELE
MFAVSLCSLWYSLLILAHFTYLLIGAVIFQILEREAESNNRNHFQLEKLHFLANYTCLDGPALEKFVQVILYAWEKGVNPSGNSTNPSNWDFSSSFFFAGTVVTTIGYGNLSPSTVSGQVFCVFYALCGIPLNLAFLKQMGKCLTIHLGRLETGMRFCFLSQKAVEALAVSLFFITGSLLFLVIPPLLFSYVEGWTFGEAFYFAFITLSTIGFGDYVVGEKAAAVASVYLKLPGLTLLHKSARCWKIKVRCELRQTHLTRSYMFLLKGTDPGKEYISLYRCLAGIWIIFALAWLALILNMGVRIMENLVILTHPGFKKHKEEDEDVSSSKLEVTSKI